MSKFKRFTSRCTAMLLSAALVGGGMISGFSPVESTSMKVVAEAADTVVSGTNNADKFSWDNATVYFLLTDRFKNGNTANDHSYNRGLDKNGKVIDVSDDRGTFHGGDFAGVTQAIEEGYFDDLGVNALWISAAYEQIHGYIVGGDGSPSFAHYSYHGYYVLDYTQTDANFGTAEEFKTLVDTAHEHGIRVVMDIVMNHAGYNSLYDMVEYGYGTVKSGWDDYYYPVANVNNKDYHSYIDYETNEDDWANWWGKDWIRCGIIGYTPGGGSALTQCLAGLPDFITEKTSTVGIPKILETKWKREGRYDEEVKELNAYLTSHGYDRTVTNCISYWLSSWVREYGVDGFRCDTAKHVEFASWKTLSDMCTEALETWRKNNPTAPGADWTDDFWMTGEAWDHGVSYDGYYTQGGFDSMINFDTWGGGVLALGRVSGKYNDYAAAVNTKDDFNILSFISSHDAMLTRGNSIYMGSAFLLLPGAVQIYYGDETDRELVSGIPFDGQGGAGHSLRSDMNWDTMNEETLAHWQKVGTFRNNHVAVGAGDNTTVTTSSGVGFVRTYSKNGVTDRVAACIGASANTNVTIDVSDAWKAGDSVVNYYDSASAVVAADGTVTFNSGANGTILIGDPDGKPLVSVSAAAKFKGTTTATISIEGADSAIVSVDGGKKFIAHNGDTFTIGETAYEGDTITVTCKATNEKGTANSKATFYKGYADEDFTGGSVEKPINNTITIRIKPYSASSAAPYLHVWSGDKVLNGGFPGKQLTEKDENGNYVFTIDGYTSVNCIVSGGANVCQSENIEGISSEALITVKSADYKKYDVEKTEKVESKYSLMKQAARSIKNLVKEDYTTASYNKLYSYVAAADALVAQGEENADIEAVNKMYNDIVAAKSALVLVAPRVKTASVGSKVVSGKAPCEANVTITIGGKAYNAVADEVTGVWTVNANTALKSTDVIYAKATLGNYTSATSSYNMSGGNIKDPLAITLTANKTNISVGDSVKLTASAEGGNGDYTYSYLVYGVEGNVWYRFNSTFTSANTYTWKATSTGTKKFYVEVKDSTGKVVRSAAATVVVSKNATPLAISASANKSTMSVGDSVTVTAKATGGSGSYTYSFLVWNTDTNAWFRLNNTFTTGNTITWKASSAGNRKFFAEVKDSTGKVVRSAAAAVNVQSGTSALAITASSSGSSVSRGSSVTITAKATGGSGSYTYSFLVWNTDVNSWFRFNTTFNSASTLTWKASSIGNRKFYAEVKDSTGKVVRSSAVSVSVK